MARIPPDEIERLKQTIALERLVEAAGIELKRHGKDLIGRCPFHNDKTPSLVISPQKNLWHCLGACQSGGSVIDWVMKQNGVSFRHAVELLREGIGAVAARPVKQTSVRALSAPVAIEADDQALLNQVIDYYHETLKQSPEAIAYLAKRGLHSPEAIARFKLGYANRTLGLRLPAKVVKSGRTIRTRLAALGLYRDSGHEHFNGSLIVPIFDEHGHVSEIYGRKILDNLREGTAYHLYLPGPHRGVWNLEALKVNEEIILCEALIDALTFWVAGYRNVTASYSVEGFTQYHLAAFKRYGTKRVLIAYDRDEAGDRAAERLAEKLLSEGIDCYRIEFPKGMDANDYALKVQPAAKSLGMAIRKSVWLGKGRAPALTSEALIDTNAVEEPMAIDLLTEAHEAIEALNEELAPSPLVAHEETAALPASPVPSAPREDIPVAISDDEVSLLLGDRRYRCRGLNKNTAYELLRVNLLVSRVTPQGEALHVDTFDLYSARHRASFIHQAALELAVKEDVIKKDLARVLLKLEQLQDALIKKTLAPTEKKPAALDATAEREALTLLKDPKLLDRILADFHACGVVGEETNKLVGYLAATSRKLDRPLAVIVQSTSAAGKSSLMDACLAFIPEEERIQYSAMTGQALYYMGSIDLKHKVLALSEEQGASRAAYALKLLQSEGKLTIASTGKNPETGELVTKDYHVEGPVMIFMTTTAIDLDDELLNRCLVLAVDENREQTKAIHQLQREAETLEGLLAREERAHLLTLHQNAQRLLKPLRVVNPYARSLTFPDTATRTRRDHTKYLALIRAIAFLHQHQRPIKTMNHRGEAKAYIDVTVQDIEVANRLAHDVLGRTLDELPPQPRRLLCLLDQMVKEACTRLKIDRSDYRFSRREVRAATHWGDTQLRLHLDRLVDLEYVLVHRGGRGQSFVYELLYDGAGHDGRPFVPGLIDVEQLRSITTTESSRGQEGEFAGSSRGQRGPIAGGSRVDKNDKTIGHPSAESTSSDPERENALLESEEETSES
jgi:DNA primase catalytic core